ncbi:MAG: EAL domain-containing protein [Caulobacteraceae bacterium]|nr:EAL domain-containing protein [Caulobacteraceae bacterium]
MSLSPQRLLGFAFASADLLVEIDEGGKITLAVGAGEALAGAAETALVGRAWRDFVDAADVPVIDALFAGLESAARRGPVVVRLAAAPGEPQKAAGFSACRLPYNVGAISCALTRATPVKTNGRHGLHDAAGFEAATRVLFDTAASTGVELEMALIEMQGLALARGRLDEAAAGAFDQKMSGALRAQSYGGSAAAGLGGDRYALVRQRGESVEALTERLGRLLALDEHGVKPAARSLALTGEASPSQAIRAIRYALDSFISDGMDSAPIASLGEAVQLSVRRTLEKAGALSAAVNDRRFRLVYQPVVRLKDGSLHHHEALVRFGDDASPFPMIRMAEELDLIEQLDLAIVEEALKRLAAEPALKLAVNVSGRTIGSEAFIANVTDMLAGKADLKGRLMFELTESAAIDDLAAADRRLQALRAQGCLVCLDDFGAGAASLAYLQQLSLDVVKIDGRYIRELQHGGRESTFIRHLVSMCAELGVRTLAEMVETEQAEEAVRHAGVDFAQGWLYGAAADKPGPPATARAPVKPAARRMGMVEGWG